MGLDEKHSARYAEMLAPHVPEPVLAGGYVSAAGSAKAQAFQGSTMRAGGAGAIAKVVTSSIGAKLDHDNRDTARAVGFPPGAWLAVSAGRIYAFTSVKGQVGEPIGSWPRATTTVTMKRKAATTGVHLDLGSDDGPGGSVDLEARNWGAGSGALLRHLADPTLGA